jgi:hypothetical protein
MKSLKDYLQNLPYSKKTDKASVYNEKERPKNAIRIWISYDIDKGDDKSQRNLLYDWLSKYDAESWGNSVATFLWKLAEDCEPTNEIVAQWIVEELIQQKLLLGSSFEDMQWQNTKDISLYVFYRYRVKKNGKETYNSNHFVLIQNAEITHKDGFAN